ncbi:phosphate ABC transporter ATP-binding protein [uncultured Roseobacter sp.]|uniref:phosphate ABC transporter ATP-binding protein n=1 Tax=uncultured Roseobacter sp. TaxID=114847 RepID=UPI0026057A50|nr:ATP-binding cassette domain-containing protein [uncultured Roseobacter sp.]
MDEKVILSVQSLDVYFGPEHVVKDVSFDVVENMVTALIGPSGCGKTTMLRAVSRNLDSEPECRIQGEISLNGEPIYGSAISGESIRKKIRYISQVPNLFDMSVRDNLLVPLRHWYPRETKQALMDRIEHSLRMVALDTSRGGLLDLPARKLSAGEQQKLALARGLCDEPTLLLLDEPTANMDPISVGQFEEIIDELRQKIAVLIITHSMQQAARISQRSGMVHLGVLSEFDETGTIFTNPSDARTESYITGRIG